MNRFALQRDFTRRWQTGEIPFAIGLIACIGLSILFAVLFFRSFEPAQFLVLSKEWETVTELVHDETDTYRVCDTNGNDCRWETDTDTVVDEREKLSGNGYDPIAYYEGFTPKGDQYIRHRLHTSVRLGYGDTTVMFRPPRNLYDQLPLGGYCVGEIGWFNSIRRMNCSGR